MTESDMFSWPAPIPYESRFQYPLPLQRLQLAHPMRNSAPSRLQHMEDFYLMQEINSVCRSKTRSLTNVFTFDDARLCSTPMRGDCFCASLERLRPHFSGEMLLPSTRPTEEDSSDVRSEESSNESSEPCDEICSDSSDKSVSESRVPRPSSAPGDTKQKEKDNIGNVATSTSPPSADTSLKSREKRGVLRTVSCGTNTKELLEKFTRNCVLATVEDENEDETFSGEDADVHPKVPAVRSFSDSSCDLKPKLHRRKSVHFADTKGLDLVIKIPFCKELDESDTPPRLLEALAKIRAEIRSNTHVDKRSRPSFHNNTISHYTLVARFQLPFLEPTFQDRVAKQMICLESVSIIPNSHSFTGVIRVRNIEFEKEVGVRMTSDNWRSYEDIPACYVSSFHAANQDQFSFHVVAPRNMRNGDRLELALRYRLSLSGREFWDNNRGNNYVISYLEHRASHTDDGLMT